MNIKKSKTMKNSKNEIRELVMDRYKKVALSTDHTKESRSKCCSSNTEEKNWSISTNLGYSTSECETVPVGANLGLGCGNPQAIAALKPGETVLDLGSGGGFDCFLASKSVGNKGKVIGVDMTPEMISLSRRNAVKGNYLNTEFRLGEIEHLPVADGTIDVIISNCVINLSPEKEKVFAEAYRVLKPGGKLALSDVVLIKPLPNELRSDASLYSGCVSGASSIEDLERMLSDSGFMGINIVPKDKSREFIKEWIPGKNIENYIISATIEAIKKT
jgi:SAM-dependent methyltransferase